MNETTTITFPVWEVSPATTPLPEVPYKVAIESLLGAGFPGRRISKPMTRRLLDAHILEVRIDNDRIGRVMIPCIDETLEMVEDARGESPFGDGLPDHKLIEVSDDTFGRGSKGEPLFS